jgi:hypothetical protein
MTPPIKKSFNINADLAQAVDTIIQQNPGLSFTFIMNKALELWLTNPKLNVVASQMPPREAPSEYEIDKFLRDNSSLMDKLAK